MGTILKDRPHLPVAIILAALLVYSFAQAFITYAARPVLG